MGVLEHRVARLERRRQREPGRAVPAQLIVCEPDESNGSGDLPDLRRSRIAAAGTARRPAPDPASSPARC